MKQYSFPTSKKAAQDTRDLIEKGVKALKPDNDHDIFGIMMALEEALANAIKHGNQGDRNKHVRVAWIVDHAAFTAVITDQGKGFNLEDIPNPTDDENLTKPSGRGILMMRHFMDEVEFRECGTEVKLVKHFTPQDTAPPQKQITQKGETSSEQEIHLSSDELECDEDDDYTLNLPQETQMFIS